MLFHVFSLATSALNPAPHRIPMKGTHPLWNSRLRDHASRLLCDCLPEVGSFIVPAHWVMCGQAVMVRFGKLWRRFMRMMFVLVALVGLAAHPAMAAAPV